MNLLSAVAACLGLLVVLLVGVGERVQAQQLAPTWEGVYRVEGTNPDGSTYSGAVEVQRIDDSELFYLSWGLDGKPDKVAMTAFGFVVDGRLVAGGLEEPMLMTYDAVGAGRWALPRAEFSTPAREQLTRTNAKTLREAVRATRGAQASRSISKIPRERSSVFWPMFVP